LTPKKDENFEKSNSLRLMIAGWLLIRKFLIRDFVLEIGKVFTVHGHDGENMDFGGF